MNSAQGTENKIHDSALAARYGFRSGLVPGVNVYGYMTVPVVARYGRAWLERGRIAVKFLLPFYEGETVLVRARAEGEGLAVTAEDEQGAVRAMASVSLTAGERAGAEPPPECALPAMEARPEPSPTTVYPGRLLGTLYEDLGEWHRQAREVLQDPLEIYCGPAAIAHPKAFLALANQIIVRNYRISPWIHTASEVTCRAVAPAEGKVTVRASIRACYERKGHQFMTVDVSVHGSGSAVLQEIEHTAIWKLRGE